MSFKITITSLVIIAVISTPAWASSSAVQLPAVYPLVNILLPLLNNVYNLLLGLLSIFDTLPSSVSCQIPVDLRALEASLLQLYSQALALVNFFKSLPEYAVGATARNSSGDLSNVQGLLTGLVAAISKVASDVLVDIGGSLLPGLLQVVVVVAQALLALLL